MRPNSTPGNVWRSSFSYRSSPEGKTTGTPNCPQTAALISGLPDRLAVQTNLDDLATKNRLIANTI